MKPRLLFSPGRLCFLRTLPFLRIINMRYTNVFKQHVNLLSTRSKSTRRRDGRSLPSSRRTSIHANTTTSCCKYTCTDHSALNPPGCTCIVQLLYSPWTHLGVTVLYSYCTCSTPQHGGTDARTLALEKAFVL